MRVVEVADGPSAAELFERLGMHVTTMGRTVDQDPLFFAAAAAAGRLLGQLAARTAAPTASDTTP